MADATLVRESNDRRVTAIAAVSSGEVWQLKDGRAGVYRGLNAAAAGDVVSFETSGQFNFVKTTSMVLLAGGRAYWDHSAGAVSFRKVNDRDFYLGRVVNDAASADAVVTVDLNVDPPYDIDMLRDGALVVPTGTAAAGGFGFPQLYGGVPGLRLTATNEAQCVDMLSVDRFALGANAIAEFIIRLGANGSTSDVDISIGVANGTSTTDADAITESLLFHIDGGALDILAESDDGTTEVAATDTTIDITAGSAVANRFEFWFDMRDPSDVKYYINGVEVLNGTANLGNIALATGPLGLLVHLEKSSGTATAGPVYVDAARARFSEQNT